MPVKRESIPVEKHHIERNTVQETRSSRFTRACSARRHIPICSGMKERRS